MFTLIIIVVLAIALAVACSHRSLADAHQALSDDLKRAEDMVDELASQVSKLRAKP